MGFECTIEELQQMLRDGKISTDQFSKIMIDNIGREAFMKAFNSTLEEYFKDFKLNTEKKNENAIQNKPEIQ